MDEPTVKIIKPGVQKIRRSFGRYIQKHRKLHGYTQQQLADLLGVTSKTISCTERGETFPAHENIFRLAKLLNMSLDEFVFGCSCPQDELNIAEINEMLSELDGEGRRLISETVKTMCEMMTKRR